jgi:formamidopyrimidine-DNA glycosylase
LIFWQRKCKNNKKLAIKNSFYKRERAMPELPEVEAFKKYIELHCLNKDIVDVESSDTRVVKTPFKALQKTLINNAFAKVERTGKFLIISLAHSDKKLVMHFGLTGYLTYCKNKKTEVPYSAVAFTFKDNSVLHWNSVRKFEKIWLISTVDEIKELKNIGPDPLQLTQKQFLDVAEQYKQKNIKSFLMDQSIISGIGNEYSDEILFQAGVDPHHSLKDLSKPVLVKIYIKMQTVLDEAIKIRIQHMDAMGHQFFSKDDRGLFKSSYLQAHRHVDMVCPKNKKHVLKKVKIAGRTTYYCPEDQK